MPENSTLSETTEPNSILKTKKLIYKNLQPSKETLQKILQFAAIYKAEKIVGEQFGNILMN